MAEPTTEQVTEWKEKYGKIMKRNIGGTDYYYRPISFDEFTNIQRLSETDTNTVGEIETIKTCNLFPEMKRDIPAGVVMTLSDSIMEISGFGQTAAPEEL